MFVGQDFGTVGYADQVIVSGKGESTSNPTWRTLLSLLDASDIDPTSCFFTNALLGLRPGTGMTGNAPGWRDPKLLAASRTSLLRQIQLVQPSAIFALGLPAARFLGALAPSLASWGTARSWTQLDARHPVRHVVPELSTANGPVAVGALLHASFRGPNLHRRRFRGQTGEAAEAVIIRETFNRFVGDSYTRLIPSDQLRPEDIPATSAGWPELSAFIYTLEGYKVTGSQERLQEWTEGNVPPTSLDMARAMLYGHARWMRWAECSWADWDHKREFFALLEYVRAEVERAKKS
jgi:uracil-DNA glycosylase